MALRLRIRLPDGCACRRTPVFALRNTTALRLPLRVALAGILPLRYVVRLSGGSTVGLTDAAAFRMIDTVSLRYGFVGSECLALPEGLAGGLSEALAYALSERLIFALSEGLSGILAV